MHKKLLVFTLFFFICILPIMAHGDLDARIIEASEAIEVAPDSAQLYFKRGKLYYQHNEYSYSINDLKKAKTLGYQSTEQNLLFAKNYFRLDQFNKSISYSEHILSKDPKNVLAIKLKAQALFKQNHFEEAAINFEKVISYTNQTLPENYIDASVAWESLNSVNGYTQATLIIQKGIIDLGELTSLYDRLIKIAVNQKDYDFAIKTQRQIVKMANRKENAYYKLSELYMLNNNNELALESLNKAKTHFYMLPIRIQNTSFMKELLENIKLKETFLQPE